MPTTLFLVPGTKRAELDAALNDDIVARMSRKLREAPALGGPAGELYVYLEGSVEAVGKAEELLGKVGRRLPTAEASPIEKALREEDESASAGMGLFFTE